MLVTKPKGRYVEGPPRASQDIFVSNILYECSHKVDGASAFRRQRAVVAAGDDEVYDRPMLDQATFPISVSTADTRVLMFAKRCGYVSRTSGHQGASELLDFSIKKCNEAKQDSN